VRLRGHAPADFQENLPFRNDTPALTRTVMSTDKDEGGTVVAEHIPLSPIQRRQVSEFEDLSHEWRVSTRGMGPVVGAAVMRIHPDLSAGEPTHGLIVMRASQPFEETARAPFLVSSLQGAATHTLHDGGYPCPRQRPPARPPVAAGCGGARPGGASTARDPG
jgi:hypothetical protein